MADDTVDSLIIQILPKVHGEAHTLVTRLLVAIYTERAAKDTRRVSVREEEPSATAQPETELPNNETQRLEAEIAKLKAKIAKVDRHKQIARSTFASKSSEVRYLKTLIEAHREAKKPMEALIHSLGIRLQGPRDEMRTVTDDALLAIIEGKQYLEELSEQMTRNLFHTQTSLTARNRHFQAQGDAQAQSEIQQAKSDVGGQPSRLLKICATFDVCLIRLRNHFDSEATSQGSVNTDDKGGIPHTSQAQAAIIGAANTNEERTSPDTAQPSNSTQGKCGTPPVPFNANIVVSSSGLNEEFQPQSRLLGTNKSYRQMIGSTAGPAVPQFTMLYTADMNKPKQGTKRCSSSENPDHAVKKVKLSVQSLCDPRTSRAPACKPCRESYLARDGLAPCAPCRSSGGLFPPACFYELCARGTQCENDGCTFGHEDQVLSLQAPACSIENVSQLTIHSTAHHMSSSNSFVVSAQPQDAYGD